MPLSVSSMKKALMNSQQDETDAFSAQKAFGDALLKNISDDISITYTWLATLPNGFPDPVVIFDASVSGTGVLLPAPNFNTWLIQLSTLIKTMIIQPPSDFLLSPLCFNPAGLLTVQLNKESDREKAIESFCSQIINSIRTSFVNPLPMAGTHGSYIGATASMIIL